MSTPAKAREPIKQIGELQRPAKGSKAHFCVLCEHPIAVYGRLWPCLHCFCLTCASSQANCPLCKSDVTRLERIARGGKLFISPATLQAFTSQEEFIQHAQRVSTYLATRHA